MQYPANKLGTTRTGKTISIYLIDDLRILTNLVLGYDKADHFDAYALFQYLISRDMRKVAGVRKNQLRYAEFSNFHETAVGEKSRHDLMRELSLITIFDIVKFGKRCADPIFRD